MPQIVELDNYVVDVLMRDLVGHDQRPSSFLVFLYLWRHSLGQGEKSVSASHQTIATATGLARRTVQSALRELERRQLLVTRRVSKTSVPEYRLRCPWRRLRGSAY
jgi:CRP-like cAMP-binding protein